MGVVLRDRPSDAERALVRASMPMPAWMESRGRRPEEYCHREMIDAVRYMVDSGGKWMAMPRDYPWWRAVYDFFCRRRAHGNDPHQDPVMSSAGNSIAPRLTGMRNDS
ncbi:transposase (plasmid) [Streptomyces sp. QH1-20]|uniref:transposase n=1 Tax=Streptomyces sp. QH1-20 TaxID=3240934 RepID=UPI0035142D2F